MNHFSIRDIENLSGVKAHTLRVWIERFQLVCPQEKPAGIASMIMRTLNSFFVLLFFIIKGIKYQVSSVCRMKRSEC